MRTAIIAAMEEEVKYLVAHIAKHETYDFQGYTYHIGEIAGQQIVLLQSGIGKVNAALATTLLLEHFSVSEIINTGSAGGVDANLQIGDVIIANNAVYSDVDVTAFGYTYGQIPKMPEKFVGDTMLIETFSQIMEKFNFSHVIGTIATGDQFVTASTQVAKIREIYDIKAVDMEATAIAQVGYQYQIPTIIVRSISDVMNDDAQNSTADFTKYIDTAAKNSTAVLVEYMQVKKIDRAIEQE